MEILFKDNHYIYHISQDYSMILYEPIMSDDNLDKVKHLDNMEVMYYYKDTSTGGLYPVYYEEGYSFITKINEEYLIYDNYGEFVRDNTLSNLKLL